MEDIYIAIPSYNRSSYILQKTLNLLFRFHIATNRIAIFVVSEELIKYQEALINYPDISIVVGPIGLHNMRNFIRLYYPEGTYLLQIDDDIEDLYEMIEDITIPNLKISKRYPLIPLTLDRFREEIIRAFQQLTLKGYNFFGIYPVKNGYFMKDLPEYTYDLRFCVGAFWGCINQHNTSLILQLEEKEDFERTLRYYHQDGGVLRLNRIVPKTKYYKCAGGMQSRPFNRIETSKESCSFLLHHYPNNCRLYTSKKSGIWEVRLKA